MGRMQVKRLLFSALCASYICSALFAAQGASVPVGSAPADSTAAPANASSKPDYSKEPFVFEKYITKVRFENDGTGERDQIARIRVQSDAGVQALGELTFGYNSANEHMTVQYVRVTKPDGKTVTADASAIKETNADVARNAPVYTDYKVKHVTVPSLQAGDTLEYEVDTNLATPLAAGEFWYAQDFVKSAIVLDESLEVNLPDGRALNLTSPQAEYQTDRANGRVIYTWKHAQLTHPARGGENQAGDSASKAADVQFTTFKSWQEVAQWYAKLEEGRENATPELRAKVAELMQGKTTDLEKIQALYDYVAKNIRYVSLSFGLGRYQPRTAAEVFANQYGDCKDKATLLAAMMRVAGISSDVALIPATSTLDETMPSPSQFDHVVTAVPENGVLIWMDSTTEVAPFRMLASTLRDKSALLVAPDGKGRIVRTPADPPFLSSQSVETTGTVNELGKLTGTIHYTVRGDQELVLRVAFRRTPQADWKQLGSAILRQDGLTGEATSVEASDPSDTRKPFDVTVHFTQDDFLPWTSRDAAVRLPLLAIGMPNIAQDNAAPIELGSPLNVSVHMRLTLPADFVARAPVGVAVARDYAEFKSTYSLEGQTLTAERTLSFKLRELPAERTGDYLAFAHAVESDENQSLHLDNLGSTSASGAARIPPSAKIDDVMDAAQVALKNEDPQTAITLLKRVVALDPKKYEKSVWNDLGAAYADSGNYDQAITSFHKQLEINPFDENSNRYLGLALSRSGKYDAAVAAYRKQIEIKPLDLLAISQLGFTLNLEHKYADAVPELEKASTLAPGDASVEVAVGTAYLNTGANDKALAAFDRATQLSRTPSVWNDVAYELADNKLQLDKARQYAESAIAATSAELQTVDLAHSDPSQVRMSLNIASYWDTLGWVYFQQGDLAKASRYIRAAWFVSEHGTVGDHLGQILAKQGQKDQAVDAFAQALAARNPDPDTRAHLILLLGGNEKIDALVEKARLELAQQRTFAMGKLLDAKADANFELLLSPAGADGSTTQVNDVKFLDGSDQLRDFADRLRKIGFGAMFPDASPVKLVQVGTLSCTASGECSFTFALPDDAHVMK